MGRNKRGRNNNKVEKKKEINEEKEVSPFASIVLKEKAPEKKVIKPVPKNPGEIVQGYVPSASFADILDSFEKTGNPYSLPKSTAKTSSRSFGDILDQWEGKGSKKKHSSNIKSEKKSEYKATKSFADILNQYEGVVRKEKASNLKDMEKPKKVEEPVQGSTMFISGDEDDGIPSNVSWSVLGGKNRNYVKPEEKKEEVKTEKKQYERVSPEYTPSKSFDEILSSFERKDHKTQKAIETQDKHIAKEEEEIPAEPNFFIEKDEEVELSNNVVWSIMGGANKSFVRQELKDVTTEEKIEIKEEEFKVASKPYVPQKDFSQILNEYDAAFKDKEEKIEVKVEDNFEPPKDSLFMEKNDDVELSKDVVWSIMGGVNENFVRKKEPIKEEKEEVIISKVSKPYVPKKKFSSLLSSYEKEKKEKESVKTFEEIIKEKGDNKEKRNHFSINELRRMDPQATLDLHGETQRDSEVALKEFLSASWENGLRKISVITGKGLHSEDGQGVLRALSERVIGEVDFIREYSNAPLSKGGSGAIWIILKERVE